MRPRGGQGEALVAWAAAALLLVVVVVTYSRLPVFQLYRVSQDGIGAGVGRGVVLSNYPIALAAIALILIAVDALPHAAWLAAGPALALCAATGVTVDPGDLDFRPVNLAPALGVVVAVVLTLAAARRTGASFVPRLPGDTVRIAVAASVVVLSLPWVAADLGTYLPGGVFLTSTIVTERGLSGLPPTGISGRDDPGDSVTIADAETLPAVHVGHHHGLDGALLFLAALLLSRARPVGRQIDVALTGCLGLMLSYGGVNAVEDLWHEQVVKRGWSALRIPAAQVPSVSGVWLVIVLLAGGAYLVLRYERRLGEGGGERRVTNPPSPAHP